MRSASSIAACAVSFIEMAIWNRQRKFYLSLIFTGDTNRCSESCVMETVAQFVQFGRTMNCIYLLISTPKSQRCATNARHLTRAVVGRSRLSVEKKQKKTKEATCRTQAISHFGLKGVSATPAYVLRLLLWLVKRQLKVIDNSMGLQADMGGRFSWKLSQPLIDTGTLSSQRKLHHLL